MIAGALTLIASAEWTFLTVGGATGTPGDVPHRLVRMAHTAGYAIHST